MNTMTEKRHLPLTPKEIRKIRKGLNLSQAKAAEKVGVSRRSWAAWESGETVPTPPLQKLIRLLEAGKLDD
jgi:DNA-binding transcriptional regulator YiaG